MIRYLYASLVAAALGLAATPVDASVRSERPIVFLGAGIGSSIRDLDEAGSKLGTGFSAGGGLGFPLLISTMPAATPPRSDRDPSDGRGDPAGPF